MKLPVLVVLCVCALPALAGANGNGTTYGITLAPGETIVETMLVPSAPIVRVPLASAQQQPRRTVQPYRTTRALPPVEIDRMTRKRRNASGWTGRRARPAAVACFPAGVCAGLNTTR